MCSDDDRSWTQLVALRQWAGRRARQAWPALQLPALIFADPLAVVEALTAGGRDATGVPASVS